MPNSMDRSSCGASYRRHDTGDEIRPQRRTGRRM